MRVLAAGVCGSDVHIWRGEVPFPTKLPSPLGHEMIGEVYALGAERQCDSLGRKLDVGDRVTYAYFRRCGMCAACATGSSACPNRYADRVGLSLHDAPHFLGAFGDFYYVLGDQWVFKVPSDLPSAVAAPANCAVSQALHAVDRAWIRVGDTVVIQGLGGLGLYATALAKDSGAGCVIGVDGVRDRLTMARRFGADAVLDIREVQGPEDRNAEIAGLTDGAGADAVIEMAGVPAVVPEGLGYLRPGGRYVLVGNITAGATVEIAPQMIVRSAREVVGVVTYPQWAVRGQSTGSAGDRTPIPSPTWSPRATRSRRSTTRSPPPNGTESGMQAGKAVILMT